MRDYQKVLQNKLYYLNTPKWSKTISEENADSDKIINPGFSCEISWLLEQWLLADFQRTHPRHERTAEQKLYHGSPS